MLHLSDLSRGDVLWLGIYGGERIWQRYGDNQPVDGRTVSALLKQGRIKPNGDAIEAMDSQTWIFQG